MLWRPVNETSLKACNRNLAVLLVDLDRTKFILPFTVLSPLLYEEGRARAAPAEGGTLCGASEPGLNMLPQ